MTTYLDPKSGATIGYRETKGTTAEPFNVPMAWQASTLSYVALSLDASGNLMVSGGGGGGGGVQYAQGTVNAAPTGTVAMGMDPGNTLKSVALDASGFLLVNVAAGGGGGGGSNAAAGPTGLPVPSDADYLGWNSGGNLVGASVANPIPVQTIGATTIFNGTVDAGNSSTAALGANATFTGASFDAFNQGSVLVSIYSDQSSAANGVQLQWSSNGANWDEIDFNSFVAGSSAFNIQATERARYFRVVYTNGATPQAAFRLQTIHRITTPSGDVVEINDTITPTNHAQVVKAMGADESFRFDGSASPVLYLGTAPPGTADATALWKIIQINTTSGVQMKYPNGLPTYSNAWTGRAGLTYV